MARLDEIRQSGLETTPGSGFETFLRTATGIGQGFNMGSEKARQQKMEKEQYYFTLRDRGYSTDQAAKKTDDVYSRGFLERLIKKNQAGFDTPEEDPYTAKRAKEQAELEKTQAETAKLQAQAATASGQTTLPQGFVRAGGKVYKDPNFVSPQAEMKKLDVKELSEMQKLLPKLDQAGQALNQLEKKYYEGIQPSSSPLQARGGGVFQKAGAGLGFNPSLNRYLSNRKAFAGLIAKGGFGEAGMLTDQDIARVTNALPSEFSTAEESKQAFEEIRTILGAARQRFEKKKAEIFSNDEVIQNFPSGNNAQDPLEGKTAINPQTGERIIRRGGQWQRL